MLKALGFYILKILLKFESPGFSTFKDFEEFKEFLKFKRSGLGSRPEAQL